MSRFGISEKIRHSLLLRIVMVCSLAREVNAKVFFPSLVRLLSPNLAPWALSAITCDHLAAFYVAVEAAFHQIADDRRRGRRQFVEVVEPVSQTLPAESTDSRLP